MLATIVVALATPTARAQEASKLDTIECHIVGFNVGIKMPSERLSSGTSPDGTTSQRATMASLYKGPYMDYGINALYKYKSNWLVTLDANVWFGNNNLLYRKERMGSIFPMPPCRLKPRLWQVMAASVPPPPMTMLSWV